VSLPDIAADPAVIDLVQRALREDVVEHDATTLALVQETATCRAELLSRGEYTVSGLPVAGLVFKQVDPDLSFEACVAEGDSVRDGDVLATVDGSARSILGAERTALNFLQRMTGIATLTRSFVSEVAGHEVAVLDTRKTTPTMRVLEKYAVLCGGGCNHRLGLHDRVLIKDNHRRLWQASMAEEALSTLALDEAVRRAREQYPNLEIEIEVESEEELASALEADPDWVLLDNMNPDLLRRCVALAAGQTRLEASGGITLANAGEIACTGVDAISLGCLTHSAPAADLSLEIR